MHSIISGDTMMNQTTLKSAESKHEYWQAHMDEWQASKLSQSKYCEQVVIKYNSFIYWRSVLLSKQ